jgi:hypothetical protein
MFPPFFTFQFHRFCFQFEDFRAVRVKVLQEQPKPFLLFWSTTSWSIQTATAARHHAVASVRARSTRPPTTALHALRLALDLHHTPAAPRPCAANPRSLHRL